MELDTDVLRSSYLADSPAKVPQSTTCPAMWERTRCPDPVVAEDEDEIQYGVDVIHVKNSTFDQDDYRITCNIDRRSPQPLVVNLDSEQTTPSNPVEDIDAVIILDGDSTSDQIVNNLDGDYIHFRNCEKGRRKRRCIHLDKDVGFEVGKPTEDENRAGKYVVDLGESVSDELTSIRTVQKPEHRRSGVHPDKSLTENHSTNHMPSILKRKPATDRRQVPPPTFRFGQYTYAEKRQNPGQVNASSGQCVGSPAGISQTRGDGQTVKGTWHIPENSGKSNIYTISENPLASLFRYCDTVSSREGSHLQSLTDELVTQKHTAFVEMKKQQHSGSYKEPLTFTQDNNFQYGPHSYGAMNLKHRPARVVPASGYNVDFGTANSLSCSNRVFAYDSEMISRRRMMMDEWYLVQMQGRTKSWHRPTHSELPQPPKKNKLDSNDVSKSRLFGISISRTCDTSCLINTDDKVNNKENLPQKSVSCDTEASVTMDDSGIGTFSGNSSFETDTDIPNTSPRNEGSMISDERTAMGENNPPAIGNNADCTDSSHPCECISSTNVQTSPDNSSGIYRRRKYILDARYPESSMLNRQSSMDLTTQSHPDIQDSQTLGHTLIDQSTRNGLPMLQDFRDHNNVPRTPIVGISNVPPPPPLQDHSDQRKSNSIRSSRSMEGELEASQNHSNMSGALSDFKALLDAFDKSPVKPGPEDSQNRSRYPVLEAALSKKRSKNKRTDGKMSDTTRTQEKHDKNFRTQEEHSETTGALEIPKTQEPVQSQAKKTSKTHTCQCCGKGNLMMKAIRRHNLRKYSCPVCHESFCLQDLLHKHIKTGTCCTVYPWLSVD